MLWVDWYLAIWKLDCCPQPLAQCYLGWTPVPHDPAKAKWSQMMDEKNLNNQMYFCWKLHNVALTYNWRPIILFLFTFWKTCIIENMPNIMYVLPVHHLNCTYCCKDNYHCDTEHNLQTWWFSESRGRKPPPSNPISSFLLCLSLHHFFSAVLIYINERTV